MPAFLKNMRYADINEVYEEEEEIMFDELGIDIQREEDKMSELLDK